jgi:hypothetical protein
VKRVGGNLEKDGWEQCGVTLLGSYTYTEKSERHAELVEASLPRNYLNQ